VLGCSLEIKARNSLLGLQYYNHVDDVVDRSVYRVQPRSDLTPLLDHSDQRSSQLQCNEMIAQLIKSSFLYFEVTLCIRVCIPSLSELGS
jgi:hypothetical protein